MLYAKVVLGLAVEGPFDYIVPAYLEKDIAPGVRVWVTLRNRKTIGYVVGLTRKTEIKKLKKILNTIDDYPILDKNMLALTKELSVYYCCSWGEAICTALPQALRKGRGIGDNKIALTNSCSQKDSPGLILVHDLDGRARWDIYLKEIRQTLDNKKAVIVLLPDFNSLLRAQETLAAGLGIKPVLLYRKQANELAQWLKVKTGEAKIVLGTRSAIFAPFNNLGLVIIDEEQDQAYKQDQVPHYNPREVGSMRARCQGSRLILGSSSPSLESLYLVKTNKAKYILIPGKNDFPEVKIVDIKHLPFQDRKRNFAFSKILEDSVSSVLGLKGKVLLFLNRRGFATLASCNNCGLSLKCPRCNINLVYHFKDNVLNCHYCNFKTSPPTICPNCNAGYIRYSGLGTQKLESELSRVFAQARIKRLEGHLDFDIKDADIIVATSSIIKQTGYNFDLIGVLYIDNSLNRIDFRASEKAFDLLIGLMKLTDKKLIIETRIPQHHCFQALLSKDINKFYDEELRQRRELGFPPYRHMVLVKLRGVNPDKVKGASSLLFQQLSVSCKDKGVKIVSVNPAQPSKLRGNFYWQVLINTDNAKKASAFLKRNLKDFSRSGIIVTVDVDPV